MKIIEAITPDDKVKFYSLEGSEDENFIVVGGRVLHSDLYKNIDKITRINLKNIKPPKIETQAIDSTGKPSILFLF